jgi:hypothetical protein
MTTSAKPHSTLISYKYRSGAAALRCLSEGTAYFSSPRELNDSLEAKFELTPPERFSEMFTKAFNQLALSRGHVESFSMGTPLPTEFVSVNESENERFQEKCQQVGIFSTAPRPDNQSMWAYYCDNSKGVCLELEWSKEIFEKYQLWPINVIYSKEVRVHNRADDLCKSLLELGAQNPHWTIAQLKAFSLTESFRRREGINSVARAVSTKHSNWEHECEVRMLSPHAGPLPILADILKRVIFIRTDFTEWGAITMLLHRMYPNVQLAQLSFDHKEPFAKIQDLEFKKIPLQTESDPWNSR